MVLGLPMKLTFLIAAELYLVLLGTGDMHL